MSISASKTIKLRDRTRDLNKRHADTGKYAFSLFQCFSQAGAFLLVVLIARLYVTALMEQPGKIEQESNCDYVEDYFSNKID